MICEDCDVYLCEACTELEMRAMKRDYAEIMWGETPTYAECEELRAQKIALFS